MEERIEKIRKYFREMYGAAAPTTSVSAGNIAGFPPDSPPVKKRIYFGKKSRKRWLDNLKK